MTGLYYLASQYTALSKRQMHENYLAAIDATAFLLASRIWVFSPIIHSHDLAHLHGLRTDFSYWYDFNHTMLDTLHGLIVLQSPGWSYSRGIQDEIDYAQQIGKPIRGLLKTKDTYVFTEPESFIHVRSTDVHPPPP